MDSVVYQQCSSLVGKPCKLCESEVPFTLNKKGENTHFAGALPDHSGSNRLVELTVESLLPYEVAALAREAGLNTNLSYFSTSTPPYLELKWVVSQSLDSSKVGDVMAEYWVELTWFHGKSCYGSREIQKMPQSATC